MLALPVPLLPLLPPPRIECDAPSPPLLLLLPPLLTPPLLPPLLSLLLLLPSLPQRA
jgi:hypothetical protein